jgi:hypothetical protein
MNIAFVLGNGTSRQIISLEQINAIGQIYGCNAIYRDFVPDVLVACDKPISVAIQESGYPLKHRFHTRKPLPNRGAQPVPQAYYGYSSGPIATGIAAIDGHKRIYLLGFDMGPSPEQKINNIYAGTEHYRRKEAPPTYTGNWIKQLMRIMEDHKMTRFVRVCGATTAHIAEFAQVRNLEHIDMATFQHRINNPKDL